MFKKMWIIGLGVLFNLNAYALETVFGEELPIIWSSIITLTGGVGWAAPGQNQFLYPNFVPAFPGVPPLLIEHFKYTSKQGILAMGEVFFGLQRNICPTLIGELGIGLSGSTDSLATGVININEIPAVNSFSYKVDQGRVLLKGKIISNWYRQAQPYISGGFGAGFNNSHAYVPTTVNPILFPTSWFTSNTNIAFSYILGFGVQTKINPNWQVGIGYEFADWGKSFLGSDPSTLFVGPGLTHLYTNQVLLSLSYLF